MAKKKIYLATFNFKLLDRNTPVLLKTFNGKDDFYDFFKNFADDIFSNIRKTHAYKDNNTVLHLTLEEPIQHDINKRVFYGYLSSGVGGDDFKVRNSGEKQTKFESNPDTDITYRKLFFYFQLPLHQAFGYLILQKKKDFGVKGSLEKALKLYLREKGYNQYYPQINNMLNGRVFDKMMQNGNLKNIDFIKRSIPSTIEELYEKGLKLDKGVLTTSIRSNSSLSQYWKNFITTLYKTQYKENIVEIENVDSLDEVEFEMELKGKKKTFHILSKQRTLPDVEVSEDLVFNNTGPTIESLVSVSEDLINDMLTLTPNVAAN